MIVLYSSSSSSLRSYTEAVGDVGMTGDMAGVGWIAAECMIICTFQTSKTPKACTFFTEAATELGSCIHTSKATQNLVAFNGHENP